MTLLSWGRVRQRQRRFKASGNRDRFPKPVLHLAETSAFDVDAWDTLHKTASARKWTVCNVANVVTSLELAPRRTNHGDLRVQIFLDQARRGSKPSWSKHQRQSAQHRLSKTHALEEEEDAMVYNTSASSARAKALMVEPTINGTPIWMELDTGSALSIIPDCLYRHHLSGLPLSPTSVVLKTYSGERIKPLGVISVDVEYNDQHHDGKALIVKTDGPPLFGRNWLQHIQIDWSHVHHPASSTASTQHRLDKLLARHSAVFGDDRGRFRHCKGRLHLVDGAKPRFFKA